MSEILRHLNERPIAYYPIYRELTKSTTAGIMLSQLMYWFAKKDTIFKTDADFMEETKLTADELKNAKNKIKNLDFIIVEKKGLPAKTYYTINWQKYQTCIGNYHKQVCGNPPNLNRENTQAILYTENTTEITYKEESTKKSSYKDLEEQIAVLISNSPNLNIQAAREWIENKKYKSIVPITKVINFLSQYTKEQQQQIVDASIMNGWQGLFPLKNSQKPDPKYDGIFSKRVQAHMPWIEEWAKGDEDVR